MTSLACGGWFPPHFPPPILQTPIMCPRRGTVRDTHTLTPFSSLISGFGRSVLLPSCRLNGNAGSQQIKKLRPTCVVLRLRNPAAARHAVAGLYETSVLRHVSPFLMCETSESHKISETVQAAVVQHWSWWQM